MDYPECGYDATFVSDTPHYLRCSVCHFVLRNPVFVISCGHKFCRPCFDHMKTVAGTSALLCPIDRNIIDVTKVCDELDLRRTIGCLVVKCRSHQNGCTWEGQLSDLDTHQEQCQYQGGLPQHHHPHIGELVSMVTELRSRMDRYEETLEEKNKELAHVRMKWKEEVDALKLSDARTRKLLEDLLQENAKINATMKGDKAATHNQMSILNPGARKLKLLSKPEAEKLFELFRGPADVLITDGFHLNFGEEKTVLGLPTALVSLGDKIYFEVACTDIWEKGTCGFGWASHDFKPSREKVDFVYKIHGVKWYFPTAGSCYEDGNNVSPHSGRHYGKKHYGVQECELGNSYIIGVAADMTKGQLLYSFNGSWDVPMGAAFTNLSKTTQYFPVLFGKNLTLILNFGDTDFKHAPPDQSYKKCNALF